MTQRRRFLTNADDVMSYRCFSRYCDALFFCTYFLARKHVTYNTLLLETDVDFIAGCLWVLSQCRHCVICAGIPGQDLSDIHTCPLQSDTPPQHNTQVKTQESNVSLPDEQKVKTREGRQGGAQMHNLSKSHRNAYLFNKEKYMQTNEFACGCNCVLRSSLTRPGLL